MWPTERIRGGHTSVKAMPRSYQVTPVDPRAATGDTAKASQTQSRSTGEKRVSPPPPGSQTDEPDDTDRRGRRLSLRRRAGAPRRHGRDLPRHERGRQAVHADDDRDSSIAGVSRGSPGRLPAPDTRSARNPQSRTL